jgi:hypothetical protein
MRVLEIHKGLALTNEGRGVAATVVMAIRTRTRIVHCNCRTPSSDLLIDMPRFYLLIFRNL